MFAINFHRTRRWRFRGPTPFRPGVREFVWWMQIGPWLIYRRR